jgi:hypothetical protein
MAFNRARQDPTGKKASFDDKLFVLSVIPKMLFPREGLPEGERFLQKEILAQNGKDAPSLMQAVTRTSKMRYPE